MDILYAAGLFDGEGSIGIYVTSGCKDSRYRSGRRGPSFIRSVSLGSCYLPILKKVQKLFGCGRIAPHKRKQPAGNKQMYYWHVGAKTDIENVLSLLYPHLHEKKNQARIMLSAIRNEVDETFAMDLLKKLKLKEF